MLENKLPIVVYEMLALRLSNKVHLVPIHTEIVQMYVGSLVGQL